MSQTSKSLRGNSDESNRVAKGWGVNQKEFEKQTFFSNGWYRIFEFLQSMNAHINLLFTLKLGRNFREFESRTKTANLAGWRKLGCRPILIEKSRCRIKYKYWGRPEIDWEDIKCWTGLTYLLTPWSRVLLEKLTGSAASQEIPRILRNTKGSSPYSQVPATCPYPEPTPSSPHNPLPFPEDPS